MKKLEEFTQIDRSKMNSIHGGTLRHSSFNFNNVSFQDTWDDANDDGMISSGEHVILHDSKGGSSSGNNP